MKVVEGTICPSHSRELDRLLLLVLPRCHSSWLSFGVMADVGYVTATLETFPLRNAFTVICLVL